MFAALAGLMTANLSAQVLERLLPMGNVKSLDSRSGQFVVLGATSETYIPTPDGQPAPNNCVRLDPGIVVFTCERVKDDLLRALRARDEWRGRITVTLRADIRTDGPMVVNSLWMREGWHYQVVLPYYIDPTKLIRAMVRSLLLEMANRNNQTPNLADIPLWLQEGLAHELLIENLSSLVLDPRSRMPVDKRQMEPVQTARLQMSGQPVISFSDLSLPTETEMNGKAWDNYCANAHLFVAELLALRNGPERIQESLRRMPNYLNPQLAFLGAFSGEFRSALAVEKWWSLAVVNLSDRDQYRHWSPAVVVQRLDEILQVPVAVRVATNAVPTHKDVGLGDFLETANHTNQRVVLTRIIGQLEALLLSCPPAMGKIVSDYHIVLSEYVKSRDTAPTMISQIGRSMQSAQSDKRDVIKAIRLLDLIRGDLRHYDPAVSKTVAQSKPGN